MEISVEVLELLGCGALIFDAGMKVRFANSKAGELLGKASEALLGRSIQEIDAIFLDPCGGAIPEGKQPLKHICSSGKNLAGRELALKRQDGTLSMVSLNAAPFFEKDGRIAGLIADFTDISQVKNREKASLRGRQRLNRFIGSMDEIAFEFDAEGHYLHVWSGDKNLLKRPPHELLGKRLDEVVPRELTEKVFSAFQRIQSTGEPETLEYKLEVLGGVRWFLARLALVQAEGEEEPTISFLARDITELKQMEQSLQDTQRRFRGLFDNAATGMVLVDLDGHFLEANPCFCEMLGCSLEELQKMNFTEYSHPEDYPVEIEKFKLLMGGKINSYRMEKRFIRKDGEEVWGYLTVALQRDEYGAPLYSIAVIENISDRKRVEDKTNLLLSELKAIFDSTAEGIIFCDAEKILRANPAALEITGCPEIYVSDLYKSIAPRRTDGTLLPFQESAFYHALHGTAQNGEIVQIKHRDGRKVWISFSASPVFDVSGHQVGTVGTFADITPLRELQEHMENYLYVLAHEMRNPLTLISGHAQILQSTLQGTALQEKSLFSTQTIIYASDQLRQMMEDLVDFGRLESGQLPLRYDRIDLREFIPDFLARQLISTDFRACKGGDSRPAAAGANRDSSLGKDFAQHHRKRPEIFRAGSTGRR